MALNLSTLHLLGKPQLLGHQRIYSYLTQSTALLISKKCHKCLLYYGGPVSLMNCVITREFTVRQKVTTSSTF